MSLIEVILSYNINFIFLIELMKSENQIFAELSELCASKGYPHVIAFLCFRDNTIQFTEGLTGDDLNHHFSPERLLRMEISTLIGLMIKKPIDYSLPTPADLQIMIDSTDSLLLELHEAIAKPYFEELEKKLTKGSTENPYKKGAVMRESIFYSGESAYNFQYRDFAPIKYRNDDDWLKENMGFCIDEVHNVITSILKLQNWKLTQVLNQITGVTPDIWTYLPTYCFTLDEVINISGVNSTIVKKVITAFTLKKDAFNTSFKTVSDFNEINATPILQIDDNEYLLFQQYNLTESFYESPFFWMLNDSTYKDTSLKKRGEFAENFAVTCLSRVFGSGSVYKNVNIHDSKKNKMGEIDVLVVYSDRAIIVQAKSKRLTIKARKGNEAQLHKDFQDSIQKAYDQGFDCSELIQNQNYSLNIEDGELQIDLNFKEIYIFCVISDHFPALTFQSFQNLDYKKTEKILAPFVMDIFHLDVMTEMLDSPLYFLSYVKRRIQYADKILATNEGVILSYHLKNNLWVKQETDFLNITDDWSRDLDAAMFARREFLPGERTPDGILTRYQNTPFDRLLKQLSGNQDPISIELGLFLLQLSGETINKINEGMELIRDSSIEDGKNHDFSIGVGDAGITLHCNKDNVEQFEPRLRIHSAGRKYLLKSDLWFGVCIDPIEYELKCVMEFNDPWERSKEMDKIVKSLPFNK